MIISEICKKENLNKTVKINGWVNSARILGKIGFLEVRDYSGKIQGVIKDKEILKKAKKITEESCISIKGTLLQKKDDPNKFELAVSDLEIHNIAGSLPFTNKTFKELNPTEESIQKYRYLYLRTEKGQEAIILRSRVMKAIRDFLYSKGFHEIETPILSKSTPEGARDYLIPSRLHPGKFYALPQSPQIYKQLLMVSGFLKYFQIAKSFRDEDLRADRQPEFTQVDLEMSFVDENEIMQLTEELLKYVFKTTKNIDIETPFKKIDYMDAVKKYGTDKPDLRFDLKLNENEKEIYLEIDYNKNIDEFLKTQKEISFEIKNNKIKISINKPKEEFDLKPYFIMGEIRDKIGELLNLKKEKYCFLWVVNFPMFEYSEEEKRFKAAHHPFTMPKNLDAKIHEIKSIAYDVVLNGYELGGGSIRIHKKELQEKVFELLGINKKEAEEKFGFFLKAFDAGMPPHGGLALGLDRLVMLLNNNSNIREVIAFPKTKNAEGLMEESPSEVSKEQLDELHIEIKK